MNKDDKDDLKIAAGYVGIFLGSLFTFIVAITGFAYFVSWLVGE